MSHRRWQWTTVTSDERKPTDEQQRAIEIYLSGENLVLEAGAGTGKTTALEMIADSTPNRRGLYLAFNRSVAEEARRKFGRNVECRTANSIAYGATIGGRKHRLSGPRQTPTMVADALSIPTGGTIKGVRVARTTLSAAVMRTLATFCRSTSDAIDAVHVGDIAKFNGDADPEAINAEIVRLAGNAWTDVLADDGVLRLTHDHLLKQWSLSDPKLAYDFILFDEAQDADELILKAVKSQGDTQVIVVGDASQSIYGWRGAISAMDSLVGTRAQLTQSWRFGDAIADEANTWLNLLGANLRLTGNPAVNSEVRPGRPGRYPKAILCRTNGGMIRELFDAQQAGVAAGIPNESKKKELVIASTGLGQLYETGKTRHPEFASFGSWEELTEYAEEDPDGQGVGVLMSLVEKHGAPKLVRTLEESASPEDAELTICTAHIAKGLEWSSVRICDDFRVPRRDPNGVQRPMPRDEAMLAYVSVTRAKRVLDNEGLRWIHSTPNLSVV